MTFTMDCISQGRLSHTKELAAKSEESLPYVIHSDEECERLELQAELANIEGYLRHLPTAGA